jgi:chemotaxis methyl-accepting protein methylase
MAALPFSDLEFRKIASIMYEAAGLSYNDSKKSLIHSRLSPRIQKLGLGGFPDYIAILEDESEAAEFQMAVDLLTTNETYFFASPSTTTCCRKNWQDWVAEFRYRCGARRRRLETRRTAQPC